MSNACVHNALERSLQDGITADIGDENKSTDCAGKDGESTTPKTIYNRKEDLKKGDMM